MARSGPRKRPQRRRKLRSDVGLLVPDLARRSAKFEPRKKFILFCEGKNTEPSYFRALKARIGNALIDVEIVDSVGVANRVASKAVEFAEREGLDKKGRMRRNAQGESDEVHPNSDDSFADNDEVWAIFDHDEQPDFEAAVALCKSSGIGCARSNPCFELWLLLHEEPFDKVVRCHVVQRRLSKLRPEYDPRSGKTVDGDDLVQRCEEAEKRAEMQLQARRRDGEPFGRPSTTVGKLTRAIRRSTVENARKKE